jgi:hypothetical protein
MTFLISAGALMQAMRLTAPPPAEQVSILDAK